MPKSLSDAEEKMWSKAKAIVAKQVGRPASGLEKEDWPLVQHIFQNIKKAKARASESLDFEALGLRLEALAHRLSTLSEGKSKEGEYEGRTVPLEKPMPGESKKYKVYVRNDKGNVVKVEFGDPDMEIRRDNDARRASFRARHGCDKDPGPKWKAKYWSCKFWEDGKTVTDLLKGESEQGGCLESKLSKVKASDLTTAPLSGPSGKSPKGVEDGLTKKKAVDLAKKLRSEGIFATVFPSKKFRRKNVVIIWE